MAPVPRILFVSACVPDANGTGSERRASVAADALEAVGAVSYFAPPLPGQPTAHAATTPVLKRFVAVLLGDQLIEADRRAWHSYLNPPLKARLFERGWITAGPMLPLSRRQCEATQAALALQCGPRPFDLVYVFQAHAGLVMMPLLPALLQSGPAGHAVLDWDAAERLGMQQQYGARQAPGSTRVKSQLAGHWNDVKLARHERKLLRAYDLTVCSSVLDVAYFKSRPGRGAVTAIPNCVAIPDLAFAPPQANASNVLFVGLLNYWPNLQGLELFIREIWPLVRAAVPDARFTIVGRGMAASIRAWQGLDGVEVVGAVQDVRPYYHACRVAVAPMRFSVGSSIKVLEALALGRPLVAFEASTQRHGLRDGEHVSVAADPADFARRVVQLLRNPGLADRLASAGRAFVSQSYAREHVVGMTVDAVSALMQAR